MCRSRDIAFDLRSTIRNPYESIGWQSLAITRGPTSENESVGCNVVRVWSCALSPVDCWITKSGAERETWD